MRSETARGFTLIELLVITVIVGLFGAIGVGAILVELRAARVGSAANELAGWLVAVRRSAERGIPCTVTVPTANPVTATTDVATAADDVAVANPTNPPPFSSTNCLRADPLRFSSGQGQATYAVSASVSPFVFTPRGTVCDGDTNLPCTLTTPIAITINAVEGGSVVGNARRVCIRPPLGLIEVAATC